MDTYSLKARDNLPQIFVPVIVKFQMSSIGDHPLQPSRQAASLKLYEHKIMIYLYLSLYSIHRKICIWY